mmetsp:Transcript_12373/g.18769  ORF Transcript_12373/g.18769 Transcript_12373/m.18769 type:complete len:231 (+) Transcript_12373:115-807(+)|eukprot:CAMPEP_0185039080 /NCGR_PEP_ID=MMETSP1103-20130426/35553_1 /TAXON_ID=36769 /ORGANISM="Paraphysomonas bandaiensis, Strain Caron Lab Isolate" /LENGTH=230 /DNA_ID=CAMNT_0027577833 /DNA_START=40 /DNA_END=732 /DNA_ORIENTATION=-
MNPPFTSPSIPINNTTPELVTVPTPPPKQLKPVEVSDVKSHHIWKHNGGKVGYTSHNMWGKTITQERKEKTRRSHAYGVEIRDLPADHVLCGEQGLFATKRFERFDVIGEYTGRIVDSDVGGHYVACLEDVSYDESLGVDAADIGNELRCINAYQGIGEKANAKMRTAYINSFPHVIIICTEDIEIGEEILLDYGEAYTNMYLKPVEKKYTPMVCWNELPGGDCSSDDEE